MSSKIIHDKCKCGRNKKIVSDCCRSCYLNSNNKYSCRSCEKKRKKTKNPICRSCYNSNRINSIINDKTLIGETFYNCGERNKYNFIRYHARKLIDILNIDKICTGCDFSLGIQVCHVKAISNFSDDTPICEVNCLENLILLCPNCHWLFDHGYPSIEKIKEFYINK